MRLNKDRLITLLEDIALDDGNAPTGRISAVKTLLDIADNYVADVEAKKMAREIITSLDAKLAKMEQYRNELRKLKEDVGGIQSPAEASSE